MLDPQLLSKKAIYWPELVWDNTVQTLNANTSLQQPLVNWGQFDGWEIIAQLVNVSTMAQPGVVLNVTADDTVSPSIATSLRPNQLPGPGSWVARKQLVAQLQNTTAATNYTTQADYGMWVWPIHDGLNDGLRYYFDMPRSGEDLAAVRARLPENLAQLIDDGLRPLTGTEIIRREEMSWVTQEFAPQPWTINAGQVTPVYSKRVPAGRCYVLTGFIADPSIGGTVNLANQQTQAVTLNISRDQQDNYLTPLLAGISGTRTIPLWIPATQTLTVSLSAANGQTVNNFPLVLQIVDMPLSVINAIRWKQLSKLAATVSQAGLDKLARLVLAGGY